MSPRLRVHDLRIHGVGPISFEIAQGECLGASGPSGSGKTLMLRAIADLEPHQGTIALDGHDQAQIPAPEWRRRAALLPAESIWWHDTVGEHFKKADTAAFERLGLDAKILGWPVARLSSGERQRLALLRLLENRPPLLLLDEPTANLDPESADRVELLIRAFCQKTGAAVLWVGHQALQLKRVAGRTIFLADGRLEGTKEVR